MSNDMTFREEQEQIAMSGKPQITTDPEVFLRNEPNNKITYVPISKDLLTAEIFYKCTGDNFLYDFILNAEQQIGNLRDSITSNRGDALEFVGKQAIVTDQDKKKKGFLGLF